MVNPWLRINSLDIVKFVQYSFVHLTSDVLVQHRALTIGSLVSSSQTSTVFYLFFCLLLFWCLCSEVMLSRHHCLHLWTCRKLCPCHFVWVLTRLGLFIVCCWVFLMWSGNHCPVCARLSIVPGLFLGDFTDKAFLIISHNKQLH